MFVYLEKTFFDVFILRNSIIVSRTIRKLRICYNYSTELLSIYCLSFFIRRLIEFISLMSLGKSGIIIVNLFYIYCHWKQVRGMNEFMHNATNGKMMQVF